MNAGQPWRHKNQAERIMFGDTGALISIHNGDDTALLHPVISECRHSGALKYKSNGAPLRKGTQAGEFWVTGAGDIASLETLFSTVTKINYKGFSYSLDALGYLIHDVNVHGGRIWICSSRNDVLHIHTALFKQALTSIYSYDLADKNLLMPAFAKSCETLIFGYTTVDARTVDMATAAVLTVSLLADGTVDIVDESVWATAVEHYSPSYNNSSTTALEDSPTSMPAPNSMHLSPNMSLPELPWVSAASSGKEWSFLPSGVLDGGVHESTLDAMVDTLVSQPLQINYDGLGGTWEYHHELADGPSSFTNSYPPEYNSSIVFTYPGFSGTPSFSIGPPCFGRLAKMNYVGVHKDSGGAIIGSSTSEYYVYSHRVGRDFNYVSFPSFSTVNGSGNFGYTGDIPLGWVRGAASGEVNKVFYRETAPGGESASTIGQGFGALYSCKLFGAQVLSEQQTTYDLLPASLAFELTAEYGLTTQCKEGLFIGDTLQFEVFHTSNDPFFDQAVILEEASSVTYQGGFTTLDRPTALLSGAIVANYQSEWGTSITASADQRRESSSGVTYANFQMRVFYIQENYHADLTDMLNGGDNTATYNRRREVFLNGSSIFQDIYTAAINAYKSVPGALDNTGSSHGLRRATGAAFGKKGNLKLLLSLFDQQGNGVYRSTTTPHYYWGDVATVTPGNYQVVIDTDGVVYDNIPIDAIGGTMPIDSLFNNDELGSDFVVINVNP